MEGTEARELKERQSCAPTRSSAQSALVPHGLAGLEVTKTLEKIDGRIAVLQEPAAFDPLLFLVLTATPKEFLAINSVNRPWWLN